MRGAIIGDIIGSAFENNQPDAQDFQLLKPLSAYTDNTITTLSTADAILHNKAYGDTLKDWVQRYPKAGYRPRFLEWALSENKATYVSEGDGAARRISPIGFASPSLDEALRQAEMSTVITHNTQIRIEASKAVAGSIFLAKQGKSKSEIKQLIEEIFNYKLDQTLEEVKLMLSQTSDDLPTPVPAAMVAFLASSDFEDAIRKAVWLGGPTHTIASITGGIAQAYYNHIPKSLVRKTLCRLPSEMEELIEEFEAAYLTPVC
ncbi:ADP-ribosylglycohydrolase [Breznakibacter xylanolyticus]|uniref:ADP-ribosylglycohydrolase n=1 Tax=Breznakibacter xylanolyticus TaxID=990 RepID=A0A2W7NAG2_9BACT|nr:ADP-ribosylglycohydrolase family protein [Breznakibacter xylanolyticus]PZX17435.1 ADP-ribosylglycohydrolase [Breznakibacter xylanolyticus]